jgi:predicted lipoprotein with Yx(FWY)xxD motif
MRIRLSRAAGSAVGRLSGKASMAVIAAGAVGAAWLPIAAGGAAASAAVTARPAATGTVIATANTAFGTALVVGSGKYAGYSLYFITSDHGTHFGCTTTPVTTPLGPILCTGPSYDKKAEWPAITTHAAPVAGPGVSQRLLGTVDRAGIGEQITYAGHPLYLFDNGPGEVTGEGWDEPDLPPWHGVWNLMAPSGLALPWIGSLTTTTVDGQTVLATPMQTGAGWFDFPVYSYSKDTASSSACTGYCARRFPPVLTSGTPGLSGGLAPGSLGTLSTRLGTQVSYDGKPLYLFGYEKVEITPTGIALAGNGNGKTWQGGTFSLIPA